MYKNRQGKVRKPVYPSANGFIGDVLGNGFVTDDLLKEIHATEIESNFNDAEAYPIAIWGDKIYRGQTGKSGRHMSIRPPDEEGFPDFVGSMHFDQIDNNTGHYATPAYGHEDVIPSRFKYKPQDYKEEVIRLTMLSSPDDYTSQVLKFRSIPNLNERAMETIKYLEGNLGSEIEARAKNGNPNNLRQLYKTAGKDLPETIYERMYNLERQRKNTYPFQPESIKSLIYKENSKIDKQLKIIKKIIFDDGVDQYQPYSFIKDRFEELYFWQRPKTQVSVSPSLPPLQRNTPKRQSKFKSLFSRKK